MINLSRSTLCFFDLRVLPRPRADYLLARIIFELVAPSQPEIANYRGQYNRVMIREARMTCV